MRVQLHDPQPASLIRRRRIVVFGALAAATTAAVVITATTLDRGGAGSTRLSLAFLRTGSVRVLAAGHLPQAVHQAAGASGLPGTMLVLGGRDGARNPVSSIQRLEGGSASIVGRLPTALPGGAAAALANTVYVFGGVTRTSPSGPAASIGGVGVTDGGSASSAIIAVPVLGGRIRQVGRLPAGLTDAAVATVAGTAFIVGGFDGSREVDGVLAWQPGGTAHRTAHLPVRLRSPAVASIDRSVIIVGGVSGGVATRNILRLDPPRHRVTRIGLLPVALAHAAAGALRGLVFVIGGRGRGPGSETRAIYAIDPQSGRTTFAGALPEGLADATIATVAGTIVIAGGINRAGIVQSAVLQLVLRPGR